MVDRNKTLQVIDGHQMVILNDLHPTAQALVRQSLLTSTKPLGEWSFQNLVDWSALTMQLAMLNGESANHTAFKICEMTARWRVLRTEFETAESQAKVRERAGSA